MPFEFYIYQIGTILVFTTERYLPDRSDIARLFFHSIIVGGEKIPSNRECVGATDMAISIINAFTRASIVCYLLVLSIVIERHEC